jgi:hypothetical protein
MTRPTRQSTDVGEPGHATLDRATMARLAAHERWARVRDRTAATAPARAAAYRRFVAQASRLHPGLPEDEILKRAASLRSAHAIRAARARWHRATPEPRDVDDCGVAPDKPPSD